MTKKKISKQNKNQSAQQDFTLYIPRSWQGELPEYLSKIMRLLGSDNETEANRSLATQIIAGNADLAKYMRMYCDDLLTLGKFISTHDLPGKYALPDETGQLQNLHSLALSKNNLSVLPETMGDMASLRMLDLVDNAMKILPKTLKNLDKNCNLILSKDLKKFFQNDYQARGGVNNKRLQYQCYKYYDGENHHPSKEWDTEILRYREGQRSGYVLKRDRVLQF